ncbi:MAG: ribose 5-phosphate isomerase B [bacterium]
MKKLITEQQIIDLYKKGISEFEIENNSIITPLANDKLKEYNIKIVKPSKIVKPEEIGLTNYKGNLKVAIGSDHTGFNAKKMIFEFLTERGYNIEDLGTYNEKSCDYPDFALLVAKKVALKEVHFGILFDATGIPSSITANKLPGIRAATCYNEFTAKSAREHNNANIIVMGAKMLGDELIKSILITWLNSSFLGERHQKRLDKIKEIEMQLLKENI